MDNSKQTRANAQHLSVARHLSVSANDRSVSSIWASLLIMLRWIVPAIFFFAQLLGCHKLRILRIFWTEAFNLKLKRATSMIVMDDFDLRSESDLQSLRITSGATWLSLMEKCPNGRLQGKNPIAYVAKVNRYEKLNEQRQDRLRNRHRKPIEEDIRDPAAEDPLESLCRNEEIEQLRSAISRLSFEKEELIRLACGLSNDRSSLPTSEIAKRKGVSRQAIEKRLRKIKEQLCIDIESHQ